jgi:hypothetical protein
MALLLGTLADALACSATLLTIVALAAKIAVLLGALVQA